MVDALGDVLFREIRVRTKISGQWLMLRIIVHVASSGIFETRPFEEGCHILYCMDGVVSVKVTYSTPVFSVCSEREGYKFQGNNLTLAFIFPPTHYPCISISCNSPHFITVIPRPW